MEAVDFMGKFTQQFQTLEPYLPGSGDPVLRKIRHNAMLQALNTKPPTYKQNTWKYARLESLLAFEPTISRRRATIHNPDEITSHLMNRLSENAFVFVNGFYMPSMSIHAEKSPLTIKHFRTMSEKQDSVLETLLEASSQSKGFFHHLNTALANDGVLIIVPSSFKSEDPILITHILVDYGDHHYWVSPQTHIYVEKEANATIIENTIILGSGASCLNSQTYITLHPQSQLHYLRVDKGNVKSNTLSHIHVTQHDASDLTLNACTEGGGYHRFEIENELSGKASRYQLQGLMLPSQSMHHDWVTKLNHLTPACDSVQTVKSIIGDEGHGSYLGSITVNQQSVKTNALMENHHLLLTENGKADSSPQFEIFCDDVKCNHGSSTGQLDENLLFYLESRGMNPSRATEILLSSYINAFIKSIKNKTIRVLMRKRLKAQIRKLAQDVHHEI